METQKLFARLYLEGLSTGDFEPVFRQLLGEMQRSLLKPDAAVFTHASMVRAAAGFTYEPRIAGSRLRASYPMRGLRPTVSSVVESDLLKVLNTTPCMAALMKLRSTATPSPLPT